MTVFDKQFVDGWLQKSTTPSLIYQGSRDGFGGHSFHKKCDGKEKTFSIIKSEQGYVFGGFSSVAWNLDKSMYYGAVFNSDPEAFIFSVTHQVIFPVRGEDAVINH